MISQSREDRRRDENVPWVFFLFFFTLTRDSSEKEEKGLPFPYAHKLRSENSKGCGILGLTWWSVTATPQQETGIVQLGVRG